MQDELPVDGGGAASAVIVALAALGLLLAVVSLATRAGRVGNAAALAALVMAVATPSAGVLALMAERRAVEHEVQGYVLRPATAVRVRGEGYRASRRHAWLGFACGAVVLAAGALALVVSRRGRRGDGSPLGGPLAVVGLAAAATAGAVGAALGPVPESKYRMPEDDKVAWALADARELVDADREVGCDALDAALDDYRTSPRSVWPPVFDEEPGAIVPDWRETATRCARATWDDIRAHGGWVSHTRAFETRKGRLERKDWDRVALLHAAILLDPDLRTELLAAGAAAAPRPDTVQGAAVALEIQISVDAGPWPDVARAQLLRHGDAFLRCHRSGDAGTTGSVRAYLEAHEEGWYVADRGGTVADAPMRSCVLRALEGVRFPAARVMEQQGLDVTLTFLPRD